MRLCWQQLKPGLKGLAIVSKPSQTFVHKSLNTSRGYVLTFLEEALLCGQDIDPSVLRICVQLYGPILLGDYIVSVDRRNKGSFLDFCLFIY